MLPILKNIKNGKEYTTNEIIAVLQVEFKLTQSELNENLKLVQNKIS